MNISEVQLKLIQEMKKECHEILWQLDHPLYRHNGFRRLRWKEISDVLGVSPIDCMSMWKSLKCKHTRAKNNLNSLNHLKDGGTYQILKYAKIKEFINEMNYFDNQKNFNDSRHPRRYKVLLPTPEKALVRVPKTKLPEEPDLTCFSQAKKLNEVGETPSDVIKETNSISKRGDIEIRYDEFGEYVAAELRHLPARHAILLQQELQNCITHAKLSCLEHKDSSYSRSQEDVNSNTTSPSSSPSLSNDKSNDYDVLSHNQFL